MPELVVQVPLRAEQQLARGQSRAQVEAAGLVAARHERIDLLALGNVVVERDVSAPQIVLRIEVVVGRGSSKLVVESS